MVKHKKSTEYKRAAWTEKNWAHTALDEARSERTRAMKLPKRDPLRQELEWDSRIAYKFYHVRIKRANRLNKAGK